MRVSAGARWILRIGSAITLAFLYLPLIVIAIYAFNDDARAGVAAAGADAVVVRQGVAQPRRRATRCWTSVKVGLAATVIAMILGTLAAYALARFDFFGKNVDLVPRDPADRAARASSPAWR